MFSVPYICKTGTFPLGHPQIYNLEDCFSLTDCNYEYFDKVEGLVKCDVLPARSLFHPVLPIKANNRLIFGLCRSCIMSECVSDCTHSSDSERMLSGTWLSTELAKELNSVIKL